MRVTRLLQLVRNRRPVEKFADRPVPTDAIETVLEIQEALARHRIAAAAFHHPHVRTAPVLIAGCARIHSHVTGSGRPSFPLDVSAALQTMMIAAADLGLHASWIYGFRESDVRAVAGIPDDVPVVGLLALGYPDGLVPLPERRPHEETIAWDRWRSDDAHRALP